MKTEFERLEKQGIVWTATPAARFVVESLNGSLTHPEKAEIIKSSPIRRVLALELRHGDGKKMELFVKHHRRMALKESLKDLIRISKARNEWRLTRAIAACGVPTVEPLAFGERRRLGILRESYFVSKRLPACESVHELVLREAKREHLGAGFKKKREFILELARLIARVHQKGIDHRDLHAGNVLIEKKEGNRFYLLDLDRAKIHPRLSRRRRVAALAQFSMFFTLFVSRADRLRFFKEYYRQDPAPWSDYPKWARLIEDKTQRMVNRLYRRRDKCCLKENKHFRKLKTPPFAGFFRKEVAGTPLAGILRDPEKLFQEPGIAPIKESREKIVKCAPFTLDGKNVDVMMKRYQARNGWQRLKGLFRWSKGKKCWYAANALHQRRISTALPLAYIAEKRWGIARKNYFFYEFVPNSFLLALYLRDCFTPPLFASQPRLKRALLVQCAHFIRHLHERGIYHADLKAGNILVQEKRVGEFEFYLIDFDDVKICRRISRARQYRNLMQLNKSFLNRRIISGTDRLAFLKAYLPFCSDDRRSLRPIWKQVSRLTARRLRKTAKAFTS